MYASAARVATSSNKQPIQVFHESKRVMTDEKKNGVAGLYKLPRKRDARRLGHRSDHARKEGTPMHGPGAKGDGKEEHEPKRK